MKSVNTQQAKTQLSALLAEVEATGEPIVICRGGKPIADLVPHRGGARTVAHPVLSQVRLDYDPTAPLEDEDWPEAT
jgi:prevent-host-death family protein